MSLLRNLSGRVAASALLALTATSLARAQTQALYTVFEDTFANGSTLTTPSTPAISPATGNSTTYSLVTTQAAHPAGTPSLEAPASPLPGKLRLAIDTTPATTGVAMANMAQAVFSDYPVKLAALNDYIELTVTFTAETALLTDSTNQTNLNAPALLFGLYNTTTTASAAGGNPDGPNRDTTYTPELAPNGLSFPLSAYVHQPNPVKAGGQLGASTGNNLGNLYPPYWKGYTSRHHKTTTGGGRNQSYVHAWNAVSGVSPGFNGSGTALNPNNTLATLPTLTVGQQYTAVFKITRENTTEATVLNPGAINSTKLSTRLVLKHDMYAGPTASGTAISSYQTGAVSSNTQHIGVVFNALSAGIKLVSNGASGSTHIMAINSIKVATTGKSTIKPIILTAPASSNAAWGDSHTFSVVANGGGDTGAELSYQWSKAGTGDIAGATSSTFTIPALAYSDAGTYFVRVSNVAGITTSTNAVLVVNPPAPPKIATIVDNGVDGNPVSISVISGNSASFTVVGAGAGLSYKWQKSTDGVTFTDIPGATTATYTIARTQGSSIGQYRGVVINSSGSATSTAATLSLTYSFAGITPSGYAASATGGGNTAAVEVSTPAAFKTLAESTSDAVITVAGVINLNGKVSVKSNKTIQGKDGESTVIGNLELLSGVGNVIIRGLNITNPAGNGVTITGASNVYISHVSFFNCSDTLLAITGGADNVTVSWSEFYYTASATSNKAVLVGNSSETKPISVTFDHNWWSDNIYSQMPEITYGRVHMYNNLFQTDAATPMGNDYGTRVHANAQFFSERNQYTNIKSPLTKEAAAIGLVRTISNLYTSTSGTGAYEGADFLTFAPPYSYQMAPASSVVADVSASAGNITGASASTPTPAGTASITSTATTVPLGGSFILTAATQGFSVDPASPIPPYQWRLNGTPIGTPTTVNTLSIGGATGSNTGNYTVTVTVASGQTIVSTPITITATSGSSLVPSSSSEAAGGGGAPSLWFLGALGVLAGLRRFFRK